MLFSYSALNELGQEILSGFHLDDIADFQEAIVPTPEGKKRVLIVLMKHKRAAPTKNDKFAMQPAFHEIWDQESIERFYSLDNLSYPNGRKVSFFEPNPIEDEVVGGGVPPNVHQMKID